MKRSPKVLLRLYPAEFRAEYGPEMDVLRTAPKEHLVMWHNDSKHALHALRCD